MSDCERRGNLLRREREKSAIRRGIDGVQLTRGGTVRLAHERRAEQDSAIDDDLERADLEPFVTAAEGEGQAAYEALDFRRIVCARDPDGHRRSQSQAAGLPQRFVGSIVVD